MRKLLAIGVVTVSLANFGTCLAQTCSAAPFTDTAASTILHHTSVALKVTEQRATMQD